LSPTIPLFALIVAAAFMENQSNMTDAASQTNPIQLT
jgi:hypothetical protein